MVFRYPVRKTKQKIERLYSWSFYSQKKFTWLNLFLIQMIWSYIESLFCIKIEQSFPIFDVTMVRLDTAAMCNQALFYPIQTKWMFSLIHWCVNDLVEQYDRSLSLSLSDGRLVPNISPETRYLTYNTRNPTLQTKWN